MIEFLISSSGFNAFPKKGFWLACTITGLALGWQALLSSAIIFSVLFFFSRFVTGRIFLANGPALALFNVAVLVQICLWDGLTKLPFWPGTGVAWTQAMFGFIATAGMLIASQHLIPSPEEWEDYSPQGYGKEDPDWVAKTEMADIEAEMADVETDMADVEADRLDESESAEAPTQLDSIDSPARETLPPIDGETPDSSTTDRPT